MLSKEPLKTSTSIPRQETPPIASLVFPKLGQCLCNVEWRLFFKFSSKTAFVFSFLLLQHFVSRRSHCYRPKVSCSGPCGQDLLRHPQIQVFPVLLQDFKAQKRQGGGKLYNPMLERREDTSFFKYISQRNQLTLCLAELEKASTKLLLTTPIGNLMPSPNVPSNAFLHSLLFCWHFEWCQHRGLQRNRVCLDFAEEH